MKTLEQSVEMEAQWLNPKAQADVEAALIYSITAGKKAQPFRIPREREKLDEMLRTGEISHEEHYAGQAVLPHIRIAEYWLDTHENLRDETRADSIDHFLEKIGKKIPTPLKQAAGWARYVMEKVFNAYRRPENTSAMSPRNAGELTGIAYYYWKQNGEQGIGVFTEGMRNSRNLVHELNLYKEPELLVEYIVEHELTHRRHKPPKNGTPEEMMEDEQSVRERVYMMYARKADEGGSQSDKYKKLAMIAHAFAYGHSGTGLMSNVPVKRKIRSILSDMRAGRYRPDARGDELYRGPLNYIDTIALYQRPGSGSARPEAQIAYRQAIGAPLTVLVTEGPQEHVAAQYEAQTKETAQYRGEQKATAEHHAETHQPAHHEAAQHQTGG